MPKIVLDSHQSKIQKSLKHLAQNLESNSHTNLIKKFFTPKKPTKSLYIHGDVGRGKSMLMKEFFSSLNKTPKLYFHFNAFMRQIHEALRDIRKEKKKYKDELIEAVNRVIVCGAYLPNPSSMRRGFSSPLLNKEGGLFSPLLNKEGSLFSPLLNKEGSLFSPLLIKEGLGEVRAASSELTNTHSIKSESVELTSPTPPQRGGAFNRGVTPKLICLDEFQVTDIADAMLLSRIFSYLFSKNITIIFTSNSKPTDLYKNGLQRELFLDFIKNTLQKNCQTLNLNSPTDYRAQYTKNLTKRYFITNKENRQTVKDIITNLTNSKPLTPTKIKIWGRDVTIKKTYNNIAVINFKDLCQTDHSASDYQSICQRFSLIFLINLPKLTTDDINEAKRFMLFIDEIYENKTALIITAKAKISEIYIHGIGSEAFKRTASRLQEIKSDNYWQASKINFGQASKINFGQASK